MLRYASALILFAAAAYVWHYNQTHDMSFMVFPFLDMIDSLEGDLEAQAAMSWKIVAAVGGIVLLVSMGTAVFDSRRG